MEEFTKFGLYLMGVNLLAFFAFWHDKQRAKNGGRRTSEKNLLLLAFLGGSFGAVYASKKFRHKTKKQPFKSILYFIIILQFLFVVLAANNPEIAPEFARKALRAIL